MLNGVGVENFKAFKNRTDLNFKKLNIFLGPNSSGKSSFLKALYLIKDSLESQNKSIAMKFEENIGDFQDILFNQEKESFSLNFSFDKNQILDLESPTLQESKMSFLLGIFLSSDKQEISLATLDSFVKELVMDYKKNYVKEVEISLIKPDKKSNAVVDSFQVTLLNGKKYILDLELQKGYNLNIVSGKNFKINKIAESNIFIPNRFLFEIDETRLINFEKEDILELMFFNMVLLNIQNSIVNYFDKVFTIGPLRYKPSRIEHISAQTNSVSRDGSKITGTLAKLKEENDQTINKINKWLVDFELGKSVELINVGNNQYSIEIINKFTNAVTNINDVGIGTSQLLPIIVESVISPANSTLIIEEPETHIHPNAQAMLADLFATCIKNDSKNFFIETHSMYLIQKIQILVSKGIIDKKDVGIYYFSQDNIGTTIIDVELEDNGLFKENFPKGFFDVAFELSKELMSARRGGND